MVVQGGLWPTINITPSCTTLPTTARDPPDDLSLHVRSQRSSPEPGHQHDATLTEPLLLLRAPLSDDDRWASSGALHHTWPK